MVVERVGCLIIAHSAIDNFVAIDMPRAKAAPASALGVAYEYTSAPPPSPRPGPHCKMQAVIGSWYSNNLENTVVVEL